MARLDSFLRVVVDQKASDLHFHAGNVPIIRHDSDLVALPFRVLSEREARRFVFEILTPEQKEEFERTQELDFMYEVKGIARFRGNAFIQKHGVSAVFRVITNELPTLEKLQMPPAIKKLVNLPNGLVLVTGPTGSGKTTTLAAMVHEINRNRQCHIITIEDPIEFVHENIQSVVTQRQVGKHTETFTSALRSALREAPDVLIVGELRDLETISLAVSAAETGVLVFGTLHTNSAAKAVGRIIDALPEESRDQIRSILAVLLRGVVAQRLCKRASGEGRIAALEILIQNWAVSHLIRDNKLHQIEGYLQSSNIRDEGAQCLDSCLFGLIRDGLIITEEGLKIANNPESLKSMCENIKDEL